MMVAFPATCAGFCPGTALQDIKNTYSNWKKGTNIYPELPYLFSKRFGRKRYRGRCSSPEVWLKNTYQPRKPSQPINLVAVVCYMCTCWYMLYVLLSSTCVLVMCFTFFVCVGYGYVACCMLLANDMCWRLHVVCSVVVGCVFSVVIVCCCHCCHCCSAFWSGFVLLLLLLERHSRGSKKWQAQCWENIADF